jgi:DUF4097 and DUF4098 domain-containing protein YvlB
MNAKSLTSLGALAVLLLTGTVDARAADGSFDHRLTVDEAILLDVNTGSGSITVRAGSGNDVTIHGEIVVNRRFLVKPSNTDELVQQVRDNPPVELRNGRLRVGYIEDRSLRKRVSISYEISVPAGTEVRADTGSGSVTISDIAAPVNVDTGSGSVTLENIGGPVKADTGSGSIRAIGVAGAFHGDTGSGGIYLEQTAPGDVVISTGSGSSELKGVIGSVHANAGSGRITIDGRQEGEWRLDTGSGSVRVSLPADAAFDLKAKSNSGGIEINHPLTLEGKISKNRVSGSVRGGGPLLLIDTGSGGITIR